LTIINKGPLYPSEIAKKSGVARTTVAYRLSRLSKLGLVKKSIVGRKSLWKRVFKISKTPDYFKIYEGQEIALAYTELFSLPKDSVLLSIQGSEAITGQFNCLPKALILEAHRVFKRKRFILKGISNAGALGAIENIEKDLIESHIGRTVGLKLFTNNLFRTSGEILCTNNFLLLADPVKKSALIVRGSGITQIVYDALSVLIDSLDNVKNFNINEYFEKMLLGSHTEKSKV
jgi:DNA-binding transcriptional ArsR family regulator